MDDDNDPAGIACCTEHLMVHSCCFAVTTSSYQGSSIICLQKLYQVSTRTTLLTILEGDSPHPGGSGDRKPKGPYFEFAKKKWETEDTFRQVRHPADALLLTIAPPAHTFFLTAADFPMGLFGPKSRKECTRWIMV